MAAKKEPQVVHEKDIPRIEVPEGIDFRTAERYCSAAADAEETRETYNRTMDTLPWSGAVALGIVMTTHYSATHDEGQMIMCDGVLGPEEVWWGEWTVFGIGAVACGGEMDDGVFKFSCSVTCRAKHKDRALRILDRVEKECAKRHLYAGVAVLLQPDDDGDLMVSNPPKVVPIDDVQESDIILPEAMQTALSAEVFLPINERVLVKAAGLPSRRGILLAGRPGTGKTLTAKAAANYAIKAGYAVFYLPDSRGLEVALRVAASYGPALLVCEDIDRQVGGKRNASVDRLLNALDGLDSSAEVVFMATTNDPESLPPAFLRPGRLDSVMMFDTPDAEAAERHIRHNLGKHLAKGEDLTEAAGVCAGLLPASIKEVCTRSVLHALKGSHDEITAADVIAAAVAVRVQQDALEASEAKGDAKPVLRVCMTDGLGASVGLVHPQTGVASEDLWRLAHAVDRGQEVEPMTDALNALDGEGQHLF